MPVHEKFDVGKFIDRVAVLDHTSLKIDDPSKSTTFGQVRSIDLAHIASLVEDYKRNPPVQLELTVFQDPGLCSIRICE